MTNLFNTPTKYFRKMLKAGKGNTDQPRDEKGRWTATGVAVAGAGLVGGALVARSGIRAIRRIIEDSRSLGQHRARMQAIRDAMNEADAKWTARTFGTRKPK